MQTVPNLCGAEVFGLPPILKCQLNTILHFQSICDTNRRQYRMGCCICRTKGREEYLMWMIPQYLLDVHVSIYHKDGTLDRALGFNPFGSIYAHDTNKFQSLSKMF